MTATRINTSTLTLGKNYTVRVTGADNDGATTTGTYTLRVADTGPTTTVVNNMAVFKNTPIALTNGGTSITPVTATDPNGISGARLYITR
ncbi:hypothetical protein ABXW34_20045, partial [Streptococcus suis]